MRQSRADEPHHLERWPLTDTAAARASTGRRRHDQNCRAGDIAKHAQTPPADTGSGSMKYAPVVEAARARRLSLRDGESAERAACDSIRDIDGEHDAACAVHRAEDQPSMLAIRSASSTSDSERMVRPGRTANLTVPLNETGRVRSNAPMAQPSTVQRYPTRIVRRPATIDHQALAGHVRRRVGGQEHRRAHHVARRGEPPIGVWSSSRLPCTSCSSSPCVRSVSTQPGASVFTRTPRFAQSSASALVSISTPPLEAQYGTERSSPTCPATELILMIEPPPAPPSPRPGACSTGTCR